jgi:hypothetical protein
MVALQLSRQSGVPPWRTIWAEDGRVFLVDAHAEPLRHVVLGSYAGYAHVVPRVIASIAVHLPIDDAATCFAVAAAFVVALLSCYIYYATSSLLGARWKRLLIAGVPWLLPLAPYELIGTIANLHWFLLPAAAVAVLDCSERPLRIGSAVVVLLAAALSDPLAVLVLPLAVPGLLNPASRRSALIRTSTLVAALAVQAVVARTAPSGAVTSTGTDGLADILGIRYAGEFIFGPRWEDNVYRVLGGALPWVSGILLVTLVALKWSQLSRRTRRTAGVLLLTSVGSLVLPLVLRGTADVLPTSERLILTGSRYFMLPFFLLSFYILLPQRSKTLSAARSAWPSWLLPAACSLWLLLIIIPSWRQSNLRSAGPAWSSSLAKARAQCLLLPASQAVEVQISPGYWFATLPCDVVGR